ncbi:MAG: ATP-dependent DNA helicase [Clostridia bacterium]|nr:ATP-dependent DNA helicase [Clostridia bacterium]
MEFTLHGEDIRPISLTAMQEGTLGHKARQNLLPEPWRSEVPLFLDCPVEDEDLILTVTGRMDAFLDGEIPCVEEIKLWKGKQPPADVIPAHWAQAVCYGHMLFASEAYRQIDIRVVYVNTSSKIRGEFCNRMDPESCACMFRDLFDAYVRRLKMIRAHIRARDASLRGLRFPFESYRPGQRDMAVQVYTAIRRQKRLFASLPTGTGKSAAVLFPAMKALGEGLTNRVWYLTARTTQRQGPHDALRRMREQPLHLWVLTLDAKDKQCPRRTVCHPDYCPRAKGHYLRDAEAIEEMLQIGDWTPDVIRSMADKYQLCPFEFSLSLTELADITIGDYNYALDPAVRIQRIFEHGDGATILIDEAHHLPDRLRDMLSGELDGARLRRLRTVVGQAAGRKHPLYKAMTNALRELTDLPVSDDEREGRLDSFPDSLVAACRDLGNAFLDAQFEMFPWDLVGERLTDTLSPLLSFCRAVDSGREIACLWKGSARYRAVYAFALDIGTYFNAITGVLPGTVCFSATIDPLPEMRTLLGCNDEDACFSAPSSFPPENLLLVRADIDLRYRNRTDAIPAVCAQIEALVNTHPGHYLAFFPSFAYMKQVSDVLSVPCIMQQSGMTQEERDAFLARFTPDAPPVLGLCVLGGLFSEGIDLPGNALDGAAVVGVGLPQVNLFTETLRSWYEEHLDAGFLYAYQIPGMQKTAQAAGRVIRTENDRGVVLLLDSRFGTGSYLRLCPPHWHIRTGNTELLLRSFWSHGSK